MRFPAEYGLLGSMSSAIALLGIDQADYGDDMRVLPAQPESGYSSMHVAWYPRRWRVFRQAIAGSDELVSGERDD